MKNNPWSISQRVNLISLKAGFIVFLFMLLFSAGNLSGAQSTAVSLIADSLKRDAVAVIRESHTTIEVQSLRNAVLRKRMVITILSEEGKGFGHFSEPYYQNQQIGKINAEVHDRDGKRIRKIKQSEIADLSYVSGYSLFDDSRIKRFEVHQPVYPYTVVVEYEKVYQGFAGLPTWFPQPSGRVSVQKASLKLIYPESHPVRFMFLNTGEPVESMAGANKEYEWTVNNLEAFRNEPLSVPAYEYLPVVYISPGEFYFHNTTGKMQSWESYGNWVADLLAGRQNLPESTIRQVNALIQDVQDDPREKAKRIYQFMQNHTRYVSIQLGIGGFQPYSADMVAKTGYGDCKALSNYTMALLAVAGIESYYTEIGSGSRKIRFDHFSSIDQTNHAILCVPLGSDTVWLECTSQRLPFGYVPHSLQNRKALVVSPDRSQLVDMPAFDASENSMDLSMAINLDADGNALASVHKILRGVQIESVFPEVWQSGKEQREAIVARYAIPGSQVNDFSLELVQDNDLFARETVEMSIGSFASKTGKRLFINTNPFIPLRSRMNSLNNRRTDFQINYPYADHKSIQYGLPEGFVIESIPDPVVLDTPFGRYSAEFQVDGDTVSVIRKLTIYGGRYPASEYNDYVDFRQAVFRADRNQIVLLGP